MSGTKETAHFTKEDVRKLQQQESKAHGGDLPTNSFAAGVQSVVDYADKNKAEITAERQANLPLPDQPPAASDFNSADQRTVNVGCGGLSGGTDALREPATGASQGVGRQAVNGLGGLPNDAVAQGLKNKADLADTTGKDYGYPQKNDPTNSN